MRTCSCAAFLFFLSSTFSFAAAPTAQSDASRVPLWPIFYRADDGNQKILECLWPLWSYEQNAAEETRIASVLWPVTRFSTQTGSGAYDRYVFPYFWGATPRGTATDSYHFAVPFWWWWRNANSTSAVFPPGYWFKYPDGTSRSGAFPLYWRTVKKDSSRTVLVPLWYHRWKLNIPVSLLPLPPDEAVSSKSKPSRKTKKTEMVEVHSGGAFPLIWYVDTYKTKAYVVAPAWWGRTVGFKSYGAFPLFWRNITTGKRPHSYTNILLLCNGRDEPKHHFWTVFPLVWMNHDTRLRPNKPDEARFMYMVFPLWWGRNDQHVYASTFPFAWSYDRKAKRFDNWSLVPLYWRFRGMNIDEAIPLHDTDALFPLIGRNRGPKPGQQWDFVMFPAYVRAKKGEATTHFFPYPLLATKKQPNARSTWLFPIFSWDRKYQPSETETKLILGFLANYKRAPNSLHWEFLRYSLLLPPVGYYDRQPDAIKTKFTAIYGYERKQHSSKWHVLYILLHGNRDQESRLIWSLAPFICSFSKSRTMSSQWIMPVWYNHHEYDSHPLDKKVPAKSGTTAVFPVSYYHWKKDGIKKGSLLDPMSFLRDEPDVMRHWSALMHLIDYKRRKDGTTETRLLWRAYHRTAGPQKRSLELFPFIYSSSSPEHKYFSIGWRLFEYERSGGKRKMRILFAPIQLSRADTGHN